MGRGRPAGRWGPRPGLRVAVACWGKAQWLVLFPHPQNPKGADQHPVGGRGRAGVGWAARSPSPTFSGWRHVSGRPVRPCWACVLSVTWLPGPPFLPRPRSTRAVLAELFLAPPDARVAFHLGDQREIRGLGLGGQRP